MLITVIIQRGVNHHVTFRQTYNYFIDSYTLVVNEYKESVNYAISSIEDFDFDIPTGYPASASNTLEAIWFYLQWWGNAIINIWTAFVYILQIALDSIILVLKCIYTFIRVLFFAFGF